MAAFLVVGIQVALYWKDDGIYVADASTTPPISQVFHVRFKPISERDMGWFEKWSYWQALKKFPTPKTCLTDASAEAFDINIFDWKSVRSEAQMQVCLHHVVSELQDLNPIRDWLDSAGFKAHILLSGEGPRVHLSAIWSKENNSRSHPFSLFSMWSFGRQFTIILPFPYAFDINMGINKQPIYLQHSNIRFRTDF